MKASNCACDGTTTDATLDTLSQILAETTLPSTGTSVSQEQRARALGQLQLLYWSKVQARRRWQRDTLRHDTNNEQQGISTPASAMLYTLMSASLEIKLACPSHARLQLATGATQLQLHLV